MKYKILNLQFTVCTGHTHVFSCFKSHALYSDLRQRSLIKLREIHKLITGKVRVQWPSRSADFWNFSLFLDSTCIMIREQCKKYYKEDIKPIIMLLAIGIFLYWHADENLKVQWYMTIHWSLSDLYTLCAMKSEGSSADWQSARACLLNNTGTFDVISYCSVGTVF